MAGWGLALSPADAAPGLGPLAANAAEREAPQTAPVILDGHTLFRVTGAPSFPAGKRADQIADRIDEVASDPAFDPETLTVEPTEQVSGTAIRAGDKLLLVVFDNDAQAEGAARDVVAIVFAQRIKEAVHMHRLERTPGYLWRSAIFTGAATAALALILWASRWAMRRAVRVIDARIKRRLERLEASSFGVLDADQLRSVLQGAIRAAWGLVVIVASVAYVEFALARFPWTRRMAEWLLALLVDPLRVIGNAIYDAIPNMVFLAILALIVRYLLEALRLFFVGVESGAIKPAGFEPEWAKVTYKLVRFGVIAFAIVIAYPYIPGSGSEAFKGISVFLGVLFSLGSSSIISNTLAGYSLIYRRAFKTGDRIKVGNHVGDVAEIRQQVTVLRTPKNETVVIPNSSILNTEIVNYSEQARKKRLILHTSVTIGYDAPWRQVEAMLLEAAARTSTLLTEPAPFVLKNALDDFYVSYEVNVYCDDASRMAAMYSELHQHIIDVFNEYGVQIMSPHFVAQPDENVVVPKDKWFEAPARRPAGERDEPPKTG